jgi:hypothetical protein
VAVCKGSGVVRLWSLGFSRPAECEYLILDGNEGRRKVAINQRKGNRMKKSFKAIIVLSFTLVVSANALFAQPYSFDENGNGIQYIALNPHPLPFEVAPDPSGGITTSPVLIYSLGAPVVSGDVALMEPNGSTIADLLRFFTPAGGVNSDVIFYAQVDDTLAGVGIPYPANPVQISEVSPETVWTPGQNQPGAATLPNSPAFEFFRYDIITEVPEPSSTGLALVASGIWLATRRSFAGKIFPFERAPLALNSR